MDTSVSLAVGTFIHGSLSVLSSLLKSQEKVFLVNWYLSCKTCVNYTIHVAIGTFIIYIWSKFISKVNLSQSVADNNKKSYAGTSNTSPGII